MGNYGGTSGMDFGLGGVGLGLGLGSMDMGTGTGMTGATSNILGGTSAKGGFLNFDDDDDEDSKVKIGAKKKGSKN